MVLFSFFFGKHLFVRLSCLLLLLQDLALITNQKRRRSSTRGGVIVIETLPEKLTKCVNVLLRLRHHKHAEYFNKPIKKAGWPEKAVDAYYNNTMSLSSSAEEEELDLSLIQVSCLAWLGLAWLGLAWFALVCFFPSSAASAIKIIEPPLSLSLSLSQAQTGSIGERRV